MRKTPFFVFGGFLLLSLFLVFTRSSAASGAVQGFFQQVFSYPRVFVMSILPAQTPESEIEMLRSENKALLSEKYDVEQLQEENEALRSQLRESADTSDLIPVDVLGRIGEYSSPEFLIVSSTPDVQLGDTVVLGNNLVGVVTNIVGRQARIATVYNSEFRLIAQSDNSGAQGVVHGEDGSLFFEEVSVEDTLVKGDLVVSRGLVSEEGLLVPEDIVVGKIVSVKDAAQASFMSAVLESLVDFGNLSQVFVFAR